MKKLILLVLVILSITLLSCDKVDPNDTILVQSPHDSEDATYNQTPETTNPITSESEDTLPSITSVPESTVSPPEETYDKDYSGRY